MKGGLAVMIELARWAAEAELAYDLGLLFFPREELGPAENPLPGVFERHRLVDEAQLVICLEPTDNTLQLGCLGNLNARVVFEGRSAHSARPWLGVNAIELALDGLRPVLEPSRATSRSRGSLFREVISVTQIHGGIATNVIPARVEATLNFRYAPDRTPAEAEARVRELVGREVEILRTRRPRTSRSRSPLVEQLRAAGELRGAAEAGVDERRRLRRARPRRGQLRPRRDALRARGRRAGRDRRARADVRGAAALPRSVRV